MSVAHERTNTTTKAAAKKTTAQYSLTITPSAAVLAGPARGKPLAPIPLEEHWLDSSAERAAKMTISPKTAAWVLTTRNPHNRRIKPGLVKRLSEAHVAGRWMVNGESVIFNWDGNLRNGQHRLTMCVETEIPIVTWVVFGVDPTAFSTMDRGGTRNTSDDLSILSEKNTRVLAAVLGMVWREEQGDLRRLDLQPSSEEAQDVLARNPAIRDAADWVAAKGVHKILHPRLAGYCFFRFFAIDPDATIRFFDDLRTGVGLQRGDPVLLLRNRLLDNKANTKSKLKVDELLALVIKAWNYRRAGRHTTVLSWKEQTTGGGHAGEPFPMIK